MSKVRIDIKFLNALLQHAKKSGTIDAWTDIAIEYVTACNAEIERLQSTLDKLLYDAQGNGFIGDNLDDAIAWTTRQIGEARRLRDENTELRTFSQNGPRQFASDNAERSDCRPDERDMM